MDLEETFNRAAKHLQSLVSELNSTELLTFYGFYKQATVGPCDIPRPSWYQTQAKQKWEAWKTLGDMSREVAMENYISALKNVNPSWEEDAKTDLQGWVAISRLTNTEEELEDTEKTFLDWVKEGNEQMVQDILSKEPKVVEMPDGDGLLPLHWAADRGHVMIMEHLVKKGANINMQDGDGQTPLHYAASCGHIDAVKYLLSIGAEFIEDNDGMTPKDIADEQVVAIL